MYSDAIERWERVLEQIRSEIGETKFRMWFGAIEPAEFSNGRLKVLFPNLAVAKLVQDVFGDLLQRRVEEVFGDRTVVEFGRCHKNSETGVTRDDSTNRLGSTPRNNSPARGSLLWQEFSLDNFIETDANIQALRSVKEAIQFGARPWNSLLLYGDTGSGKTHLLRGAANDIAKNNRRFYPLFMTGQQFATQFTLALHKGKADSFRQKCRTADILFLDGLEDIEGKDAVSGELIHTYDSLARLKKMVVASSVLPPSRLRRMKKALLDRFRGGMVVKLEPPSREDRLAIFKEALSRRKQSIPSDFLEMLAGANIDMHAAESCFEKLLKLSSTAGMVPSSKALARRIIAAESRKSAGLSLEVIKNAVCRALNIPKESFSTPGRKGKENLAAQICMYASRRYTNKSLRDIGDFFGGRDYSTVASSVRRFSRQLAVDQQLRKVLEKVQEMLLQEAIKCQEVVKW